MRILFLGNNWAGWKIVEWLRQQNEEIVGLALHPPESRKYGEEIIVNSGVDRSCIFEGLELRRPDILSTVKRLRPEIGISALFGHILRGEFLELFSAGCVNVHPAFLPHCRGAYPNVWSIVEGLPAGVTIHYIDEGVDTGDIIAQREIPIEPVDTGFSLYRKLEKIGVELFKETWPAIRSGQAPRFRQKKQGETYHRVVDVNQIDEIDLNRNYAARELIDIIRARTFPPYTGAYFWHEGRKIYLRLELLYEEQLKEEQPDGAMFSD